MAMVQGDGGVAEAVGRLGMSRPGQVVDRVA